MMNLRFSIFCCLVYFAALHNLAEANLFNSAIDSPPAQIDEQLYSRQIFVYGKSAQQLLSSSHVLVTGSNKPLAAEIVKNLALAGVGRLTISSNCCASSEIPSSEHELLLNGAESLIQYANSLNPLITATGVADDAVSTVDDTITAAVCAERSLHVLKEFCTEYHSHQIKHIGCYVRGVSGFVCDDFMKGFTVLDADGEFSKEIPLSDASVIPSPATFTGDTQSFSISAEDDSDIVSYSELRISCIDEERLGFGIGDFAEIVIAPSAADSGSLAPLGPFEVVKVENSKTAVLKLHHKADDLSQFSSLIISAVKQGAATIKKTKMPRVIDHYSLSDMLKSVSPVFVPTNGCLSDKKDRALSLCLLAAVRAIDSMPAGPVCSAAAVTQRELEAFETALISELRVMGVADPTASVKAGGVGGETIEYVAERFLFSARGNGQCPATVSVIGALAAQEVIKAITKVHVPISQFLMFESLDSVLLPLPGPAYDVTASAADNLSASMTARVYGEEVAAELARLRVFIVGSGAIGCELLKTFALMGVGTGPSTTHTDTDTPSAGDVRGVRQEGGRASEGPWRDLSQGGVVLADMDQIERSNLNRQLLFREKHVGMAKCVVAAECIKQINPRIRVKAAQSKICAETEGVFNSAFWGSIDVVATALDNIDARKYVDSLCVTHNTWMVDSGTLGSKGNTQVVIPFVSESYSSSSDPPEEDIPLCTLKSFPYQPEHCVAWARNKFDQLFSADVKTLQSCLQIPEFKGPESTVDPESVLSSIGALLLSAEEISRLLGALNSPQTTPKAAVEWAMRTFDSTYRVEAEKLLQEHPLGEVDENGVLFWGGSRRRPSPLLFDPSDPTHRSFVLWAAVVRGRACGQADLRSPADPRLTSAFEELASADISCGSSGVSEEEVADLLIAAGSANRAELLSALSPEDFEKDDAELGHVDFATAAANLRCRVYALREVDRLEVQKIAGRIVPALATTTALVAGLSALELVKIATENILRRRAADLGSPSETFSGSENTRILKKFRNSFVNLARPLLAFAQPVEAESFSVNNRVFNMWSVIEAPKGITKLTVSILEEFLSIRYGAHLQSVSVRDFLLYADFLPGSDELLDMPLDALIKRMEAAGLADREAESDDPRSMSGDSGPNPTVFASEINSFVDLEVVCVDSNGSDMQLPSVRVYLNPKKQKRVASASVGGAGKKERREKIGAAFTSVRKRLFGWGKKA